MKNVIVKASQLLLRQSKFVVSQLPSHLIALNHMAHTYQRSISVSFLCQCLWLSSLASASMTWRSADIVKTACDQEKKYQETGEFPAPIKDKESQDYCGWFQKGKSGCDSPCCDIAFWRSCKNKPDGRASARIVNGTEARKYKFPSIVKLRFPIPCGAAILNEEWVVTAAHCIDTVGPEIHELTAGEHDLEMFEGPEQNVTGAKYFIHEDYDFNTLKNDIAVLKITPPFKFTDKVKPSELPPPDFATLGAVIVIGWGIDQTTVLHETLLPIVPMDECKDNYSGNKNITDKILCYGFREGGTIACFGDSGSPIYQCHEDRLLQVGIVSFSRSKNCFQAPPDSPSGATRISKYVDWIADKISQA